eukprot:COSAG02_NODE_7514_length_2977_cov_1.808895_2_plen_67_part_00
MAKLESLSLQLRSVTNEDGTHLGHPICVYFACPVLIFQLMLLQPSQSACHKILSGSIWMLRHVSRR